MPNEYVQAIDGIPDLEAFAALVYSSNYELEIVRDPAGASAGEREVEEGRTRTPAPAPGLDTKRGMEGRGGEGQNSESEKGAIGSSRFGIPDQAAGLFENVWGKVVG